MGGVDGEVFGRDGRTAGGSSEEIAAVAVSTRGVEAAEDRVDALQAHAGRGDGRGLIRGVDEAGDGVGKAGQGSHGGDGVGGQGKVGDGSDIRGGHAGEGLGRKLNEAGGPGVGPGEAIFLRVEVEDFDGLAGVDGDAGVGVDEGAHGGVGGGRVDGVGGPVGSARAVEDVGEGREAAAGEAVGEEGILVDGGADGDPVVGLGCIGRVEERVAGRGGDDLRRVVLAGEHAAWTGDDDDLVEVAGELEVYRDVRGSGVGELLDVAREVGGVGDVDFAGDVEAVYVGLGDGRTAGRRGRACRTGSR